MKTKNLTGHSKSSASLIARTETAPNSVEKKAPNNLETHILLKTMAGWKSWPRQSVPSF
jgi:hypothetical protein